MPFFEQLLEVRAHSVMIRKLPLLVITVAVLTLKILPFSMLFARVLTLLIMYQFEESKITSGLRQTMCFVCCFAQGPAHSHKYSVIGYKYLYFELCITIMVIIRGYYTQ